MTDLELAELNLRTLFLFDDDRRIVSETVDEGRVPPRVVLTLVSGVCLMHHRADVDDPLAVLAEGDMRRGLAYAYPSEVEVPEGAIQVTAENTELVEESFPWMAEELRCGHVPCEPCLVVLAEGVPVAACHSARWVEGAAQAGVETLESHRGKGLAGIVSAAWAAAVRATGRIPIYSTSADNTASQRVATKLGLRLFCVDVYVT